jgi:transposase InsO family protein
VATLVKSGGCQVGLRQLELKREKSTHTIQVQEHLISNRIVTFHGDYIYSRLPRKLHVRGALLHPQTQGKIERWHQTLKNRILLENHFLPGDLEARIEAFVEHYSHRRYHESLNNVTPADAYFGKAATILKQRERIKRQTIEHRRLQHRKHAA